MKVIVTVQHPAHVHFFKHPIRELEGRGHEVHVFARAKDITLDLLEAYEIQHTVLVGEPRSTIDVLRVQSTYEYNLFRHVRRIDPDVLTAIGEPAVAHVATLLGAKSVLFTDTEHTRIQNAISVPFADCVCTPSAFDSNFGEKHVTYDGYHELAYLHPNRFSPDEERLKRHGVDPDDEYYVLRSIAWDAFHDQGKSGLSRRGLEAIASIMVEHGDVYITSEAELPERFESNRLSVPVERVHDLLAYANGYIGDSGTMATEAAVLGTPAIRVDPFVADHECGNFIELENEYELLFSTANERAAIEKLRQRLADGETERRFEQRRRQLLEDKIDVTEFVVDQLERVGADRRPQVVA